MSEIIIENIHPKYARALEQLQRECFPTLGEDEWMLAEHFMSHYRLFREGNFVALVEGKVVGLGSGFLIDFDFDDPDHTFMEIIDGGFYSHHEPDGDYYYGGDISVHPNYRRRGIGSRLYEARKNIVIELNRKGIVAGGLIPGYVDYKANMSPHEYVQQVVDGKLYDSTLSFQLRRGFEVRGLLEDYIDDAASDNWSTLIVWENPEYK